MNRREFLRSSVVAGAATLVTAPLLAQATSTAPAAPFAPASKNGGFKLKYAPHFGTFKAHAGEDFIDQLKFAADQGFTAWEDNGMGGRPVELQDKIAATMSSLGMTMGVFVAMADFKNVTFASPDPAVQEKILADLRKALDVAKRVNARWMTVVPGCFDAKLPGDYQLANVIDLFRRCADLCDPAGVTMVMEPLNTHTNHPGVFLQDVAQAYAICRAVNRPSCKILYDFYHQQIQRGNLIPNIDLAWSETPYFQVGDNPGRKEPGTGEVNYRNVFRHLHKKGFTGVVGMEHGNARPGKEGELAVIQAYRDADNF
jgi:hydroxypyruvate isomerase